jgi:hypothetical protein
VVHTFSPSTQEAEAGDSQVVGQPELYCETLSQKNFFLIKENEQSNLKWTKALNRHLTKDDIQIENKHLHDSHHVLWELQIKTIMRYYRISFALR